MVLDEGGCYGNRSRRISGYFLRCKCEGSKQADSQVVCLSEWEGGNAIYPNGKDH